MIPTTPNIKIYYDQPEFAVRWTEPELELPKAKFKKRDLSENFRKPKISILTHAGGGGGL